MPIRGSGSLAFLALITALVAGAAPAVAELQTAADSVVQLFCSDSDGSKHPKKTTFVTPVLLDDWDSFESVRLLLGYDPEGRVDAFRGRISARVTLHRADGSKKKLGKLSTLQNSGNGTATVEKELDRSLVRGDVLEWDFRFKKFGSLDAGECFAVLAGVMEPAAGCGPYGDWSTSEYKLPFAPGQALVVSQGNCALGSHRGAARHAYDFAMPMGTEIVAARAGQVVAVDDSSPDGTGRFDHDNAVVIQHSDGTLASYVHIRQGGALVALNESVTQGQPIAASGNSGHTSGLPHLHFQVTTCPNRRECGTEPITFSNTSANPEGLLLGRAYRAE